MKLYNRLKMDMLSNTYSMKLYYIVFTFEKGELKSKDAIVAKTTHNHRAGRKISTINFVERDINFDVLDFLLVGNYHYRCQMPFH